MVIVAEKVADVGDDARSDEILNIQFKSEGCPSAGNLNATGTTIHQMK